ncbi:hypothetical protein GCM10027612_13630 [Microbispora bryophytorum subsp. camponoti]
MTTALIHERLQSQLAFHTEIDKLKRVIRRNSLIDGSRRENDAEHSWHLAMMAMTLAEHAPPETDISRVVAMLLVHDIVEVDAGDTFIYDPVAVEGQAALERAAADRIFGLLPEDQGRGCAGCGTSSRSGAHPRRGSPRPSTGSRRSSPTTTTRAAPGRSTR